MKSLASNLPRLTLQLIIIASPVLCSAVSLEEISKLYYSGKVTESTQYVPMSVYLKEKVKSGGACLPGGLLGTNLHCYHIRSFEDCAIANKNRCRWISLEKKK